MEYKDYYKTLGVERTASDDEIKKSYRKLAMKYHPDRNPGDKKAEDRFKDINEAYDVLSDSKKRARYDQLGESYSRWQQGGGNPGNFNWADWFSQSPRSNSGGRVQVEDLNGMFGGGFSDFFTSIFGGVGGSAASGMGSSVRRNAAKKPRSFEQPIHISLLEAYQGGKRQVQLEDGQRYEVNIPAGAKTGTKIRMAGVGPAKEDLYLVVEVAADNRYERKENDLYTDTTVDLYTAVLGGEATVSTLAGNVILTIPPGSQPGRTFRLSGRGMPVMRSPNTFGDLYVRLKVTLPAALNTRQRELFEQLRHSG